MSVPDLNHADTARLVSDPKIDSSRCSLVLSRGPGLSRDFLDGHVIDVGEDSHSRRRSVAMVSGLVGRRGVVVTTG